MQATNDARGPLGGPVGWYMRAIRLLAGGSMLALVVIMIAQVLARYVFNHSLIWAEELCRHILIWQTFLLIGMAYQRGELVAVDMVPAVLRPRARLALKIATTIPILIFLWLMVVNGYSYAWRFDQQIIPALDFIWRSLTGNNASISIRWVYISVSVGCALLALHMIAGLAVEIRDMLSGRDPQKPAAPGHGTEA